MAFSPSTYTSLAFQATTSPGVSPAIMELVENGTIRVLDLLFVMKDAEGAVTTLELEALDEEGAGLVAISVEQPGVLGPEDAEEVGDDLPVQQRGLPDRVRKPLGREGVEPSRLRRPVLIDSIRIPADVVAAAIEHAKPSIWGSKELHGTSSMAARTASSREPLPPCPGAWRVVSPPGMRRRTRSSTGSRHRRHRHRNRKTTRPHSSRTWLSFTPRVCSPMRSSLQPRPRSSESERPPGPVRHAEAYSRLAGVYDEIVVDPCHDHCTAFLPARSLARRPVKA